VRRGAQSSSIMPPPGRPGAVGRASVRAGSTTRAPSVRPPSAATVTSRFDRSGTASRAGAETASSTRTSPAAGMKRKERDFETDFKVETNINVVVRCRGRNEREVGENSVLVVKTNGVMGQHVSLSMGSNALSNKSYAFDRVFSQAADQSMVFDDVVKPILGDVSRPPLELRQDKAADHSRCLLASIALFLLMAKPALARPIPCLVT
jgi:kinesin family member 11